MPESRGSTGIADDWYAESFGALYPMLYAHRTVEAAEPEAHFAAEVLQLRSSDRVLDLCCGNGRHMVHLLAHTARVTGLDYSPDLLHIAQSTLTGRANLTRGDMRRLPFANTFDVVTNFFTSFGYFEKDTENAAVIAQLAAALRPGGRFYMDYLNPEHLRAHLDPESHREAQEYTIREKRWIEDARVNKCTEVWHGGKHVAQLGESVRLYEIGEMRAMFDAAGLSIQAIYGDHGGHAYAPARPRMILLATKAA